MVFKSLKHDKIWGEKFALALPKFWMTRRPFPCDLLPWFKRTVVLLSLSSIIMILRSQWAATLCGWEGNRWSGIAMTVH